MSSMTMQQDRKQFPASRDSTPRARALRSAMVAVLATCMVGSTPLLAQDAQGFGQLTWNPSDWDRARIQHMAMQPGPMALAVGRWNTLTTTRNLGFDAYAEFLLRYPGFPKEELLRARAEDGLEDTYVDPARLVRYFDAFPPVGNAARAQYAIALRALGRSEASGVARAAWRGGTMSPVAEAMLFADYGRDLTPDDHASRMDSLLWQNDRTAAERQIAFVTGPQRSIDMARLAAMQGSTPAALGLTIPPQAYSDPGYIYNRARQMRESGQPGAAQSLLANAPPLTRLPDNPERWLEELRRNAESALKAGDLAMAVRIADRAVEAFAPGTDVSKMSSSIRDDYEKLFYPVGEAALARGDAASAARMFATYGASQRTAPARSKGFYFAGLAAERAGQRDFASREFAAAAGYPDQFYGQLALEKLGRPLTPSRIALPEPSEAARAAFYARPLVQAVSEVGRIGDWKTAVFFFRELAEQAVTDEDFALIAQLARTTGRRDLAVIAGREAATRQVYGFAPHAFPRVDVPLGNNANWSIIHAIARQESQFATDAVSHAGARGLMQLMPGTAQEQAGKMALSYNRAALIDDPQYNIRLGSGYFSRMMDVFGGSYPLAIAAYNAGPGNVGKWLRANGDPRKGQIGWVDWIEAIPFTETRRYVARVLENAAFYDALYPDAGMRSGTYPLSHYMGKQPG
ncbi:lytic transglycosylase domain-containing protein [Croceicoccus sp. F390]|uniref:Lytic transglycosylase domain-containing protein n=1 Tax=Croceicoccus esteveae TaxID=3075597 RepID=A0ABU2ZEQ6_9SPHN|nr:lytic transglycosylase domain-containing protein [Croceicoccus sp. F390]MDT0574846.1 lytic transglycosylase domain-containing protein [Croceicoccus sp. F390]